MPATVARSVGDVRPPEGPGPEVGEAPLGAEEGLGSQRPEPPLPLPLPREGWLCLRLERLCCLGLRLSAD